MLIAAIYANPINKGLYPNLRRRLEEENLFVVEEQPKAFSWRRLIDWEISVARTYHKDTIAFVDAWDFLMLGTAWELKNLAKEQDVLFHADGHCWPEPHKKDMYPPSHKPYRYVNGTGPFGRGEAIADVLEYGVKNFPIKGDESSIFADNDQRLLTDIYLTYQGPHTIKVDEDRRLSVSLNSIGKEEHHIEGKRLVLSTGIMPVFLHANGKSKYNLSDLVEILK